MCDLMVAKVEVEQQHQQQAYRHWGPIVRPEGGVEQQLSQPVVEQQFSRPVTDASPLPVLDAVSSAGLA